MVQTQRGVLLPDRGCDRLNPFALMADSHDHVEVVRAGVARPQELEPAKHAERAFHCHQRRDRDQPIAGVAHRDDVQDARTGEVRPPGLEPFRGEERTVRRAVAQKLIPLRSQGGKAFDVVDDCDSHAATPRFTSDICCAM